MKTLKIKIVFILLTISIIGLFYVIYLYNKPFIDIENTKAKIEATAQKIINDFQADEHLANKIYVDNLILVKGEIANISFNNGISTITLRDSKGLTSIICQMLPEANLNVLKLKKNDQIIIKGVCTGYLLDIIMVRCILTNDNFDEK
ncbi:hypothetical protein [Lutibacter sp.]|uniref:OB-fold protein n=1 Tax=Lutibacter sp. TaxID=1925666 RepID=UPI0027346311|nr:hypothetical protein [Lutibacter sp.]MDP3312161.1 hypothetical protein [Lutibacter sp.]